VRAALAERGSNVAWRGESGMAQCPADGHDDRTASLSIGQGNDGAVVYCQAGCDTERAVLPALGLTLADLFDRPGKRRKAPPFRVVAEYRYTDETGKLCFVKERREPKDFRIRHPDGSGGWAWNLKGVRRVLYRLPQLLDSIRDGRVVYLVEGEKDADRLATLGHAATCNFEGAAKEGQRPKWQPEYGDVLRGADVIIVADRDEAGLAHARAAAIDLAGKAKSVIIRRSKVAREHADISDHLEAGYPLDELLALDDDTADEMTTLETLTLDPADQATQLIELVRKHFELFRSDDGRTWAIENNGPNLAIPLGRRGRFAKRLARRYVAEHRKAPGEKALGDATRIVEAFIDDDDPRPVFLRVAANDGGIALDLGRADGQCVAIDASGWKIISRSPVPFRPGRTRPLPVPERRGGGLAAFRKLCNADDDAFRLAISCLVAYLIPGIPYPILVVRGEQGTAKTTFVKMLMRCIDPGREPGPLPRDEHQFAVRMWNGWVHGFDNLRDIAPYQSDMICRAATGDDHGNRTLYSDDEETSISYRRPIILNGIELGAVSSDLADREVPVVLTKIGEMERRTERTAIGDNDGDDPGVLDEFDRAHPAILGELLDMLADVLRYLPAVGKVRPLPRMADYGKILAALDMRYRQTYGREHTAPLLGMYRKLSREAVADSAKDDVVGSAILAFMDGREGWEGTTADLLGELTGTLPKPAPDKLPRGWPARPETLGKRIPALNPALRANGWEILQGNRSNRGRLVSIERYGGSFVRAEPSHPSEPSQGHSDLGIPGDGSCDGSVTVEPAATDEDAAVADRASPGRGDGCDGCDGSESPTVTLSHLPKQGSSDGCDGFSLDKAQNVSADLGWPATETGPCHRCGAPCHVYGAGGRPVCEACRGLGAKR
jgi:hypothetical protein